MIYLVFLLITGAAAVYLFYSAGNPPHAARANTRGNSSRLRERQAAIKLSLADLEYELSVGKLERTDFERLQTELLLEWEEIEAKLSDPAANVPELPPKTPACPECGSALIENAKFCHQCGFRLHQLLVVLLLFAAFSGRSLAAMDIRVEIWNGTTRKMHTEPLKVQLLQLDKGMQPVSAAVSRAGKVEFLGLPENPAAPYMVQTEYRSVTYSKVIPPNMPSATTLEIFESTHSPDRLRVRPLVELRRVAPDRLAGILIIFFLNQDNRTFTGNGGIEFHLPEKATVEQASVSVGSGASNIQWLKVAAEKRTATGLYRIAQSVKPGERILQATFSLPYDEKGTSIVLRSLYAQDTGLRLIVEPEDVEVFYNERLLVRSRDPNLERGLFAFAAGEKEVVLRLAKGGILTAPIEADEVVVRSPLETWQKLLFPVAALLIFVLVFLWRQGVFAGKGRTTRNLPDFW